jgi:predicted nucleic acid-binding Zn ribbon protein
VLNPLRSEQEAFRFLIYVVLAVAIVLTIVFVLRALL